MPEGKSKERAEMDPLLCSNSTDHMPDHAGILRCPHLCDRMRSYSSADDRISDRKEGRQDKRYIRACID